MKKIILYFALLFAGGVFAQGLPPLPIDVNSGTVDTASVESRAGIRPVKTFKNPPAKGMILMSGSKTDGGSPGSFWVFPDRAGIGTPVLTQSQLDDIAAQVGTDETRIVEDSILVYTTNGSEVGRDTLRGLGGDSGPVYVEGPGIDITGNEIAAQVVPLDVTNSQIAAQNYADLRAAEVRSDLVDTAAAIRADFPVGGGSYTEGNGIDISGSVISADVTSDLLPSGYVRSVVAPKVSETWVDSTAGPFEVWPVKINRSGQWETIGYYDDTNGQYLEKEPINVLIIGQSNTMNGQGGGSIKNDPRVTFYNVIRDRWEIVDLRADIYSNDSVNFPSTDLIFAEIENTAVFAQDFASKLADQTGRNVRLIASCHGGNAIDEWTLDADRPNWDILALQMSENGVNKFDIVLFHQGESDSQVTTGIFDSTTYVNKLVKLRADMITEGWYDGASPWIVGEIAITRGPEVSNALEGWAKSEEWVGIARAENLPTQPDGTHFDGNSKNTMGRDRYWSAYQSLPHAPGELNESTVIGATSETQDIADVLLRGNNAADREINNLGALSIGRSTLTSGAVIHTEGDARIEDAADAILTIAGRSTTGSQVFILDDPNTTAFTQFRQYNESNSTTIAGLAMGKATVFRATNVNHLLLGTGSNADFNFMTNSVHRGFIDGGTGHWGIGYTSTEPPAILSITDNSVADNVARFTNTATSFNSGNYTLFIDNSTHAGGLSGAGSFRARGSGNAEMKFTGEGKLVLTPRQSTNDPIQLNGLRNGLSTDSTLVVNNGIVKKVLSTEFTFNGDFDSQKGTNLLDGTAPTDAATINNLDERVSTGVSIGTGNALPEGSIIGDPGDIYISVVAATATVWVKATGTGNTGWTQL